MAFEATVTLTGDTTSYQINPNIKKFALKDVGFQETKVGNFVLKRSLDPNSPYNATVELKVMVNKDLTGFKLATLTGNEMRDVNIFKMAKKDDFLEQFHYIMGTLAEREIINPVD